MGLDLGPQRRLLRCTGPAFLCPNSWLVLGKGHRSLIHTDGETMLGTKLDWLCTAIVALVVVLGLEVLKGSHLKKQVRLRRHPPERRGGGGGVHRTQSEKNK
jgi:hypothetical protein